MWWDREVSSSRELWELEAEIWESPVWVHVANKATGMGRVTGWAMREKG